jgi:hypothetical protein
VAWFVAAIFVAAIFVAATSLFAAPEFNPAPTSLGPVSAPLNAVGHPTPFPRHPLVVLSDPLDAYHPLAVEIAAREGAPMAGTVDEAVALAPDFLIWVVSPANLSDQAFVAYGKAVLRAGATSALGFISGSSIDRARALSRRTLPAGELRIAAAYGTWGGGEARIHHTGGAPDRDEPLTIASFKRALQQTDALMFEGHGSATYLKFDDSTMFVARDIPPRPPLLVSTYACNTFRIWTAPSIALALSDRGTAAYIGYAYSPLPGYQMTDGFPFRHTWPGFPIGRLVQLQSAASMRGLFAFPVYHLLGDPRLSVRDAPPYRVLSDRRDGRDRVVELAPLPADMIPVRIDGGAAYETTDVWGLARVWRRDPFYNGRLQVLDVGADRYLLLQHPGGPITIRLSDRRPLVATVTATVLKGVDLCLIVYPRSDRPTCVVLMGVGVIGLAWVILRRRVERRVFVTAVVLGGAVAAGQFAYATLRIPGIEAVSSAGASPHVWMFAATWFLTAWGSLRFVEARTWRGRTVALAIGSMLNGWGPVIVWLGWPLVFNRFAVARIGSPLYNYRPGLLTLIGAVVFTLLLVVAFAAARRSYRQL